nr:SURF1 family [uncultured organism]
MARDPTGKRKRTLLLGLALACAILFLALGIWQVQRRAWKLALIAAVEERVHAPPLDAPSPAVWQPVDATRSAYCHVRVQGQFLHNRDTLVQALTEEGAGFWVLTPFLTRQGFIVLVNRGFVPADWSPQGPLPSDRGGEVVVTGLLRISEPGGGFLRSNDPVADRWFSRDVRAIAAKRGLHNLTPYFIDADASPRAVGWPRGGMTIVRFPNNHLIYSLTWFALALLSLAGFVLVLRPDRRDNGEAAR